MTVEAQPVSNVQWVERGRLAANDYNPNHVFAPELALLRRSLLQSGWTQPLVVRPEGDRFEIVDGFHRWSLTAEPEVAALTGGLVPIVELAEVDPAEQRMATVRHNRARGVHHVLPMSALVITLIDDYALSAEDLSDLLGMDGVEVSRLYEKGSMARRGSADAFGRGWAPGKRLEPRTEQG